MATSESLLQIGGTDHVRGADEPAVTIIEYGDYDCPHTRAAQAVVDRLMAENRDARIVYRPFPLRDIHANAEILARIAEAANMQGKFWPMHEHLMRHRAAIGEREVIADAEDVGVDWERLRRDLASSIVIAQVERHVHDGRRAGVHSTPTFFFNGAKHDGHYDYETLRERLTAARETPHPFGSTDRP